jgi:hypothetical protein
VKRQKRLWSINILWCPDVKKATAFKFYAQKKGPQRGPFSIIFRAKQALGLLIVVFQKLSLTRQTLELQSALIVLFGFFSRA